MANAITGISRSGTTSLGMRRTAPQSAYDMAVMAGGTPLQETDEVRITEVAAQLADLGGKLSALPPIDTSRVARISQSLADGSYEISASKIANGLLQSDRALAQLGL